MPHDTRLLSPPNRVFNGLPPYLGGKRRLVPIIFASLATVVPPAVWPSLKFLDPMSGGGSVALAAKWYGFDVLAGDVAERALLVARALIGNHLRKIQPVDIARLLANVAFPLDRDDIHLEKPYATLLGAAATFSEPLQSLLRLTIVNSYLRVFPMSLPSASDSRHVISRDWDRISSRRVGHYLRALNRPIESALISGATSVNRSVLGGRGEVIEGCALDAIRGSGADVTYLDPPYVDTSGYDDNYRKLDELLGDKRLPEPAPQLDELLETASGVPVVVLSYGGPSVTLYSLVSQISRHRPVTNAIAVPYRHLRSISKEGTNEYIVICLDR